MASRSNTASDDVRSGRPAPAPTPAPDLGVDHIRAAIEGIRYGEVRVIIQDGVIVQIERLEKQRLR